MRKIEWIWIFFLFALFLNFKLFAREGQNNRVNDLTNFRNDGLCLGRFGPKVCEKFRLKALNRGYISKEEYHSLKKNRAYPLVDYDLDPSDDSAFVHWCLCKFYRKDF